MHGGKHGQKAGERAESLGAASGVLLVTLFEVVDILKRYVGGLVRFDGSGFLHIVPVRDVFSDIFR